MRREMSFLFQAERDAFAAKMKKFSLSPILFVSWDVATNELSPHSSCYENWFIIFSILSSTKFARILVYFQFNKHFHSFRGSLNSDAVASSSSPTQKPRKWH